MPNKELLSEYATFLKNNYLTQLADENRLFLGKIGLHILKICKENSLEDLLKMSITNLTNLLTIFEEGRITEKVIEEALKLELESLPGIKPEELEPNDLLSLYTAQKQAVIAFLPKYTSDSKIILELSVQMEIIFLYAIDVTLQKYIDQRIKGAIKLKDSKIREETCRKYIEEINQKYEVLEILKEELRLSNQELKNRNDNLDKLQKSLIQRQEELINKEIELRRSNEALEHFAYTASHDLNQPLKTITSYSQILEMDYTDKIDREGHNIIAHIITGTKRMHRLINDLLEFSKIGTGIPEKKNTEVKIVLAAVTANLETLIRETGARITHEEMPVLKADPTMLTLLFQNLILNSIKYRKNGVNPEINISSIKQPYQYLFCVKDNGIGIDEKYFEKIFVIFQRLNEKTESNGTGIGLATCKKIVSLYGGKIWVESEPGKGASFYFTFPD